MSIPHHDELLLQRHLDGELDAAASAALRARLAAEPELARAAATAQALRAGFAAARGKTLRPSPSFVAGVLAATRQLPTRQQLEQSDLVGQAVRLCRRVLLAAAVLAGIGLVWHSGLLQRVRPAMLQAAPADVQRVVEELDALPNVPPTSAAPAGRGGR